ncbi:MAG: hypothetical protein UV79_C0011G0001, partial [candidate division TM6 bacterium GW2011_GWF2_43_17]
MVYALKFFKNLFVIAILIAAAILAMRYFSHISRTQEANAWQDPQTWTNPDIVEYLQNAPIIAQEPMASYLKRSGFKADFSNKVYIVTFANKAQAVFKPEEYEVDPLPYAEEAAYNASVFLGFPHIPPTTIRTIKDQTGSLQLFVKTDIDLLQNGAFHSFLQRVDQEEFALLKIFYFVFGQWDTSPGNLLSIERENKILPVCIDNGTIKYLQVGPYGTMPFVVVSPYSPTRSTITHLPNLPDKIYRASELLQSNLDISHDALRHLRKVAEKPYSNEHRRFFIAQ